MENTVTAASEPRSGSILGELYKDEPGNRSPAELGIWAAVYPEVIAEIRANREERIHSEVRRVVQPGDTLSLEVTVEKMGRRMGKAWAERSAVAREVFANEHLAGAEARELAGNICALAHCRNQFAGGDIDRGHCEAPLGAVRLRRSE